ncbi:MAG: hypothetical protein QOD55_1339, partial [Solirubrobacteraceae bacterium]|nr:hypothetical protein [Solirubrobacteraceae bacterium]
MHEQSGPVDPRGRSASAPRRHPSRALALLAALLVAGGALAG